MRFGEHTRSALPRAIFELLSPIALIQISDVRPEQAVA